MSIASKSSSRSSSSRDRVRAHRARMRSEGMRLVQIWVPDTRSPEFRAEAQRQSLMIARSEHEAEDQAFIDAISSDEP